MTEEELNYRAVFIVKDAFKSCLRAQMGEMSEKQSVETQAWILALDELSSELRKHLISLSDCNALVLYPERINALGASEKV